MKWARIHLEVIDEMGKNTPMWLLMKWPRIHLEVIDEMAKNTPRGC